MAYKIDVSIIVRDHLKTLINDTTKRPDPRDYFFFLILPIVVAIVLPYYQIFVNKDFVSSAIAGLSIYVGLSLNLIVILFEIIQKASSALKKEFAAEFIANICFSVLVSITTIVTSLFTVLDIGHIGKMIAHGIFYFFLCQMLLIVLMLLKRLYYQLLEQIGE